jgi:hypothetical protein
LKVTSTWSWTTSVSSTAMPSTPWGSASM